jgi:hypothetical protein
LSAAKNCTAGSTGHRSFARVASDRPDYSPLRSASQSILPNLLTAPALRCHG